METTSETLRYRLEQACEGSEDAFRYLFDTASDRIFAYALSHTRSRDAALDITQETFVELWKALHRFNYQSDEAFYGFLFKITKRRLVRFYKTRARDISQSYESSLLDDSYVEEHEDYRFLLKNIESLSNRYQELLRLRYWSDLSYREIGEVLEIPENTAKVWHHRAIKKLQLEFNV